MQSIINTLFGFQIAKTEGIPPNDYFKLLPNHLPHFKALFQDFVCDETTNSKNPIIKNLGFPDIIEEMAKFNISSFLNEQESPPLDKDINTLFFELFLKAYDPQQKNRRGIFHTPTSVASFIVRSIDKLLEEREAVFTNSLKRFVSGLMHRLYVDFSADNLREEIKK